MNTDHIFGIPTVLATPLITAISAILAVVFTNYFAIRRLRKEMISSLEKEKYNRTLNACQTAGNYFDLPPTLKIPMLF